jgi:hypothetical protein
MRADSDIERGSEEHVKLLGRARALYARDSDDDIEIDEDARVSVADNGAWVQGWLWVANSTNGEGAA